MALLVRAVAILVGTLLLLGLLAYLGLQIRPAPFASYPERTPPLEYVPLPEGLPAPVERFYRTTLGDRVPVIRSTVFSGRANLSFNGLRFPARWRFTHEAGQGYRHYIETTIYGKPLMKVNEHYLDGRARLELPMGVVENEPKVDMAANLGLWGESFFLPSILLTDPRVRWEPVDEHRARLVVPFRESEDTILVRFDPETGLIRQMEAMRWKEAASETKTRWLLDPLSWKRVDGVLLLSGFSITWEDDGKPWFVAELDEIVYNVDVREYIRAVGP